MSIAFQAPICLTALILESSGMATQRQCRQERPSLRFISTAEFFFMSMAAYKFIKAGGGKSIGNLKALLLAGFLSFSGSHNFHTQAALLGKNSKKIRRLFTSVHGELRVTHRETDGQIGAAQ